MEIVQENACWVVQLLGIGCINKFGDLGTLGTSKGACVRACLRACVRLRNVFRFLNNIHKNYNFFFRSFAMHGSGFGYRFSMGRPLFQFSHNAKEVFSQLLFFSSHRRNESHDGVAIEVILQKEYVILSLFRTDETNNISIVFQGSATHRRTQTATIARTTIAGKESFGKDPP